MPNFLDIYSNEQIRLTESTDLGYKLYTFTPMPLNSIKLRMDNELLDLLIRAHRGLGEVKGMMECVEDKEFIVNLLKVNESVFSCRIDDIDVECLDFFLSNKQKTTFEIEKAKKYSKAMSFPKSKALTRKFLCNLHTAVMADDEIEYWKKQQHDFLGNIRNVQSSLSFGKVLSVVNVLKYNPTPPESLLSLFDEMLEYYKKSSEHDILIKIALFHYQFESLHPFLGGNGRLGRLLINKMLVDNGLLVDGVLPFSEYLAHNKIEYFDRLWSAQCSKDLVPWVKYFLTGIIDSSNLAKIRVLHYLQAKKRNAFAIANSDKYKVEMGLLCEYIEKSIVLDVKTATTVLDVSFNTASKIVVQLVETDILKPLYEKKRYQVYVYSVIGDILD